MAMVASYFGHAITLAELRRKFSTSQRGADLASLMNTADAIGLSSRPLRLELDEFDQLKLPAILHWNLQHYVVLRKITRRKIWIHNPSTGLEVLSIADAGRCFSGVALELIPTPAFERRKVVERVRLGDLFSRMRGLIPSIIQLFLLSLVIQLFSAISPILNQLVIDEVIGKGDLDLLSTVAIGMVGLMLTTVAVNLLQGYVGLYLGVQLAFQMSVNLLRHVFRLPVSWFERRHIGDIMSRFDSLSPVQAVFTSSLGTIVLNGITLCIVVTMMMLYSSLLGAIEVGTLALLFVVRLASFPYLRRMSFEGLHLTARLQSTFLETLRGARTFKVFGRERERLAVWQNEKAAVINNSVRTSRFGIFGTAGSAVLTGLQQVTIWFLGAKMVIGGHMSLGMLFAFQAYAAMFTNSAGALVSQFFVFRTLNIHLERLADIVHAEPEKGADQFAGHGHGLRGAIAVRDLSFRYSEQDPWIVQNVDLGIEAGTFVCIVGPSGQGKTTLLKLLLGIYEPAAGEVLVDGRSLHAFGVRAFRSQIGVVMQDDQLFGGSIADNIAFFDADLDMEKVEKAARDAQVHNDIMRLPMAYMSLVGDMGSILSGGQKQRVLIARALFRNPKILFMDEGTANLDAENEVRVMDVLRSLDITRVFVGHSPAAMAGADRLLMVCDGAVTELSSTKTMDGEANPALSLV